MLRYRNNYHRRSICERVHDVKLNTLQPGRFIISLCKEASNNRPRVELRLTSTRGILFRSRKSNSKESSEIILRIEAFKWNDRGCSRCLRETSKIPVDNDPLDRIECRIYRELS